MGGKIKKQQLTMLKMYQSCQDDEYSAYRKIPMRVSTSWRDQNKKASGENESESFISSTDNLFLTKKKRIGIYFSYNKLKKQNSKVHQHEQSNNNMKITRVSFHQANKFPFTHSLTAGHVYWNADCHPSV